MDELRFQAAPPEGESAGVLYSPVRLDKLLVLSLLTFGLYEIVWFFRNWRYVRDVRGEDVVPWGRALFAPLWYHKLLQSVGVPRVALLSVSYLILTATWRLPDPWWLLSSLSVLALVPTVQAIDRLNGASSKTSPTYGWRKRSIAVACLGVLSVPLTYVGTVGPSTSVVAAEDVRSRDLSYLEAVGILSPDEELLYFYSTGFLSIRGTGALASDLGVTSYWIDPVTEELTVAFLSYGDIAHIETNPSSTWFEDTIVRLTNSEGGWFSFSLSAEDGGDVRFMDEVEHRIQAAAQQMITV